MALTATATPKVTDDILSTLAMDKNALKFKTPAFRSNLFYSIALKDEKGNIHEDLISFILKTFKVIDL